MVWVPIALTRDVPVGTTLAVVLEGRELIVSRVRKGPTEISEKATAAVCASAETGGMVWINRDPNPGPPPLFLAALPIASLPIASRLDIVLGLLSASAEPDAQLAAKTLDGIHLNIGWHVVSPKKLVLHVVALDPGDVESRALVALHRLRTEAERAAAARP